MKLILLICSSTSESWQTEIALQYQKKISRFYDFSIQRIQSTKSSRNDKLSRIEKESKEILRQIKNDDYVILFDERGDTFSSQKFAKFLETKISSGKKRILFIIGGPYGVNSAIKEKAQALVQLSHLTFNHLIAEAVALEQIYRTCSIVHNHPYHNE